MRAAVKHRARNPAYTSCSNSSRLLHALWSVSTCPGFTPRRRARPPSRGRSGGLPEVGAIPPLNDVLGESAAALTQLAFSCNDLMRLRYVALAANAAFIAYGLTAQLWPVPASP